MPFCYIQNRIKKNIFPLKFHFDKKYFLIYSKCFVHSHSVNTGCWISSISEHSALVTSIFFHLNMIFFLQHNMLCKQLLLNSATLLYKANLIFLKIYRSSIFRKYIVHFFVTTVLFWRSNFQIRMYHKKLHILFTIARLKNKKILLFYMFINFAWTPSTIFLIFLKAEFLILYSQSSFALLYTSSPFSFNCLKPLTVN